jgi:hypothetical protein
MGFETESKRYLGEIWKGIEKKEYDFSLNDFMKLGQVILRDM